MSLILYLLTCSWIVSGTVMAVGAFLAVSMLWMLPGAFALHYLCKLLICLHDRDTHAARSIRSHTPDAVFGTDRYKYRHGMMPKMVLSIDLYYKIEISVALLMSILSPLDFFFKST